MALVFSFTSSACGVAMTDTAPLALQPSMAADAALFEALTTAARGRGYEILIADASRGSFTVSAQYARHGRRAVETYTFEVQCYREGWVTVVPTGPRVRRDGDHIHLPSELRREYRDLVIALREAVGPHEHGGADR